MIRRSETQLHGEHEHAMKFVERTAELIVVQEVLAFERGSVVQAELSCANSQMR